MTRLDSLISSARGIYGTVLRPVPFFLLLGLIMFSLPTVVWGQDVLNGWQELGGKTLIPVSDQGVNELSWSFTYGKDPSVLVRVADSPWQTAKELTFSIRSDRAGRLFLRLDQKGGKIFLTNFDVTQDWRQVRLAYADFDPFGATSGTVDPASIDRVYLVDLNGSDGGVQGGRQVFIKNLAFNAQETAGNSLPLVAFDATGKLLNRKQFEALGTSGGRWCYLSDSQGAALPMKLGEKSLVVDGNTVNVPAITTEATVPATLEVLYWPVGDDFKVRLQADGNGAGIQKALRQGVILVNLELARTRYLALTKYVQGTTQGKFDQQLRQIGDTLAAIDPQSPLQQQAATADRLLLQMLTISRDAVRLVSRTAVAKLLAPGPEVQVPTPKPGTLAPGTQVTVQLYDPAFRLGMGQGFGFVTKHETPENVDRYYTDLRARGFNMVTLPLYWDQIMDAQGKYTQWQDVLRFDTLARLGYTMHAHGFVQSGMPAAAKTLKGADFLAEAERHTDKLATDLLKRYDGQILYWQAINEPASNAFGGTAIEARVKMVSDLIGNLRTVIPGATVVVNDYDWERGLEADRPDSLRTITGTIPFYRALMKQANRPDVLAVEWYPGCRVNRPEFKVDLAEPCMDLLEADTYWDRFIALGRPLIFTESNFPGSMKSDDKNGYAWGRWNAEAQAQAAVDTFMLALSKPEVWGWVWWSITDDEPWNPDGGLYTSQGKSKPVLDRLTAEVATLKKAQTMRVGTSGSLPLPLLPGTWRISVDNGPSWFIVRSRDGKLALQEDVSRPNIQAISF